MQRILVLLFIVSVLHSCKLRPKCPIKSCETKMVHIHSGKEFRGRPWYKKQNPRTGELNPELNREGKKY